MKQLLFSLLILGVMNSASAATPIDTIDADYSKCMDSAESTVGYNNCISSAYKAADAELNKVYKAIKSQYSTQKDADSKEIVKRLVASERAWIKFRDANCELAGIQMLGGTGEGPMVGGCLVSTTIDRVHELQSIFSSEN